MAFSYPPLPRYSLSALSLADVKYYAPWLFLGTMFVLNLVVLWPGQMSSDSALQYDMALTHQYSDHHPPMMSLWWGILDSFYKGPGLMFLFHLALLYGACALFLVIFASSPFRWLYAVLPLIPPISFYSSMIWKDIGFGVTYLFVIAVMSLYMMRRTSMPWWIVAANIVILFYGTAIKFQAQYVLPLMLLGLMYCYTQYRFTLKTVLLTVGAALLFMLSLNSFNNFFVPEKGKAHSWQWVKLYDLAGMSIATDTVLFPDFIVQYQYFSMPKIKEGFSHEGVHLLSQYSDCPMCTGHNQEERTLLWNYWFATICRYPWQYLQHRWWNWLNIVNVIPIQRLDTLDFSGYPGLRWFCAIQQQARRSLADTTTLYDIACVAVNKFLFGCCDLVRYLVKPSFLLPFILFYFVLGWLAVSYSVAAVPLLLLNGVSIALLITFFFFTMGSTIRFIFIMVCMTHASHAFAYRCFQDWRQRRSLS